MFVTRRDRTLNIESFDDPQLKAKKIGVQLVGDDYANSPPAHALSNRGIIRNVVGYSVVGDYRQANPPARIVEAVANGDIDVAIVWGPLAGYFASKQKHALALKPVSPQVDLPFLPFVFDISVAVRRGETKFKEEIESILDRRRNEVQKILDRYGIPRVE
jgi:ABC-type amino acid transport substrate-binding protein